MTYAVRRLFRDDCASGGIVARPGLMIARIFASALARRLAAVIVAGVLAWMGIGSARAAPPCNGTNQCSRAEAAADCQAQLPGNATIYGPAKCIVVEASKLYRCQQQGKNGADSCFPRYLFYWQGTGCPAGQEFNEQRGTCQTTCSSRSTETVTYQQMIPSGSYACSDGCTARITPIGDRTYHKAYLGGSTSHCNALPNDCSAFGAGYGMNYGTSMCQPPVVECNANEVKDPISGMCSQGCEAGKIMDANGVCKAKEDSCPPGQVKSPTGGCLPGEGQCAAGEARGKDGTCKRDSDGDGKPDAGEEEGTTDPTFSGGDSCDAPPACSGSPILCGQARIQWRIDCNTRRDRQISGGACNNVPTCIGKNCDALEYASLLQQWKASCALEKLVSKTNDNGDTGQPEWTKVAGMNQNPGAGELASDKPVVGEKSFNTDDLDQSGFGGGSCIGLATVSGQGVVGSSYAQTFASPPAAWCNFISNLRASLIIISAALSCFIIARGL